MTDQRLSRRDVGDGGPRVVLLHGLLGRGRNLATAAAGLAERGYRATMLDLPNHGRSPWTASMDLRGLAAMVAAELGDLDPPVHLVGHSLGGKTAMQVALRHPELVASLVVVDIAPVEYGPSGGSEHAGHLRAMRAMDLAALASRSDADELLAADVHDARVRGFLLQNLARTDGPDGRPGWRWDANLAVLARDLEAVVGFPTDGASAYEGPTLFLAGADSGYVSDRTRPAISHWFPHARLVRVKGAGHWVHSEQPEVFVRTVLDFLASVTPGSGQE